MTHTAQVFEASDPDCSLLAGDGALSFVVRRSGRAAYVERLQPLGAMGKLQHVMSFNDLDAFDRAYAADPMRFAYPFLYRRLRQVVAEVLQK